MCVRAVLSELCRTKWNFLTKNLVCVSGKSIMRKEKRISSRGTRRSRRVYILTSNRFCLKSQRAILISFSRIGESEWVSIIRRNHRETKTIVRAVRFNRRNTSSNGLHRTLIKRKEIKYTKRVQNNCTTRQSPLLNQTEQLFKKKSRLTDMPFYVRETQTVDNKSSTREKETCCAWKVKYIGSRHTYMFTLYRYIIYVYVCVYV